MNPHTSTLTRRLSTTLLVALGIELGMLATAAVAPANEPRLPVSAPSRRGTVRWVEQEVSFRADGITVYGSYRHPLGASGPVPAAVLIQGSGPSDRNDDGPGPHDHVGTMKAMATWLSGAGVATIRYDKPGTGRTGLGPYAHHRERMGVQPFFDVASGALRFLAAQPGIDARRLGAFGHSEGALYALLLATRPAVHHPTIRAIGLVEPISARWLDLMGPRIIREADSAAGSGQITRAHAAEVKAGVVLLVRSVRTTGKIPPNLPAEVAADHPLSDARYLHEIDGIDPAEVAAHLPRGFSVLVTCSDADIQVSCHDVSHLVGGLRRSRADIDRIRLSGVDHVLKEDPSRTYAHYTDPLPFSTDLRRRLQAFARDL
jgi:hypothetical protein